MKKKIEMFNYNFNEFVIIYNLYFVFHYLFRGRFFFFKDLYWIYKSKDRMGKINNSIKNPRNKPNIRISRS